MGWANRITIARLFIAVASWTLLLLESPTPSPATWWLAFWLFVLAAGTDALDGAIARHLEDVSVFGRIADPLVDKMLVLGTSVVLLGLDGVAAILPPVAVVIMLAREFLVTALRSAVEGRGVAYQAVLIGKLKLVVQCIAVGSVYVHQAGVGWVQADLPVVGTNIACVLVWIATLITFVSGVEYGQRAVRVLARD